MTKSVVQQIRINYNRENYSLTRVDDFVFMSTESDNRRPVVAKFYFHGTLRLDECRLAKDIIVGDALIVTPCDGGIPFERDLIKRVPLRLPNNSHYIMQGRVVDVKNQTDLFTS